MFAASPFLATLSQPTNIISILPDFIKIDAILSHCSVVFIPALLSSNAVSLAPCKRGLVSSQYTCISSPLNPFSSAIYIGAVAVPYFAVANVPALQ